MNCSRLNTILSFAEAQARYGGKGGQNKVEWGENTGKHGFLKLVLLLQVSSL